MCSLLRSEFVKVDDFRFFFFFCMRIHNQHAFTHPYRGLLVLAQGCRRAFCLFPSFLADLHARPALWNEVTREVALFAAIGEPSWSMSQRPNRLTWSIPFFSTPCVDPCVHRVLKVDLLLVAVSACQVVCLCREAKVARVCLGVWGFKLMVD